MSLGVKTKILADMPQREEPDSIHFEVGRFDPAKNVKQATAFGIEYHVDRLAWWGLRPLSAPGSRRTGVHDRWDGEMLSSLHR